MPDAPTVRAIVKSYLDRGGEKMDEKHYQSYRMAVLTGWLERSPYYEYNREYVCLQCREGFVFIDDAIVHLETHYPDFFMGW